MRPRAYTTNAYNALPSGFRPTPSLAELAGYQRPPQQEPSATAQHYTEQQHGQLQGQLQSQQQQGRPPQRKVSAMWVVRIALTMKLWMFTGQRAY